MARDTSAPVRTTSDDAGRRRLFQALKEERPKSRDDHLRLMTMRFRPNSNASIDQAQGPIAIGLVVFATRIQSERLAQPILH